MVYEHGGRGADFELADAVGVLKALAEPTRLRILVLLSRGELSVKDLTRILGQSQPRISRHLKLLAEAGLVDRAPEGSWVYFRLTEKGRAGDLARQALGAVDSADAAIVRDQRRAESVQGERQQAAQAYFQAHAGEWDRIRALHVAEADVEAAVSAALGDGPFDLFVDLGTGTGRMLELFAPRYRRGLGLDLNPAMLAYARAKLEHAGITQVQVRQADIYEPLAPRSQSTITDQVRLLVCLRRWPDRNVRWPPDSRLRTIGGQSRSSDSTQLHVETLDQTQGHFVRRRRVCWPTQYELRRVCHPTRGLCGRLPLRLPSTPRVCPRNIAEAKRTPGPFPRRPAHSSGPSRLPD
jgi:DNA-binding transcriptional ArsR family regulator